jgi:hypothetical protein
MWLNLSLVAAGPRSSDARPMSHRNGSPNRYSGIVLCLGTQDCSVAWPLQRYIYAPNPDLHLLFGSSSATIVFCDSAE